MMVHFILPGETLQSIAEQINLENPIYLKEFHNQYCAREDYIDQELIPRRKLLLPDAVQVKKYNAKNDAPFKSADRNPKMNFDPAGFDTVYKVYTTESSTDEKEKTIKSSFSYTISLKWIKNEFGNHIFYLSKNHFSNANETKVGDLAISCIQSINPLEIHTNDQGEIIQINLLQQTKANFQEIKGKLLDRFPDPYAEIYIEEFENAVFNQQIFQKKMKEDWFMKTYFAPIRNEFKNGRSFFKIFLEEENSLTNIIQEGYVSENHDEVILTQNLNKDVDQNSLDFTGKYILSKENGMIKSLDISHSYSQYGFLYSTELKIVPNV